MATHDYVIANQSGAAFRTDLNNALAAIVSNNSNSSSPATTYAYQWWADTSAGVLKIRNSANNAWIELLQLDGTLTLEDGSASAPALAFRDDLDTGIFSSAANAFDIATAGVQRLTIDASGNIAIGHSTPSTLVHINSSSDSIIRITKTGSSDAEIKNTNSLDLCCSSGGSAGQIVRILVGGAPDSLNEVMRIDGGQKVAIGTSTTTEKLLVAGAIDFTGAATGNTASSGKLTYESGTAFLNSKGPDTSTRGKIGLNIAASDGSSGITVLSIDTSGNATFSGSLSKGSGSFKIDHPLPEKKDTHNLVHSFVEAPQADNIYRGKVDLVNGTATVNIDMVAGMTEGTFILLNREIQCFTSNETGWTAVKGSVSGNILTITVQDNTCTDTISWLVIGERQDSHIKETDLTDENGKIIVEPLKIV
tara:strand:+ start:919 stop:2181 length:1263 start_codon:yes stop_codon:yes gene_type:complete